jgi:hypothetical protein
MLIALVSSDGFANVGDLFVDLSPVARVTIGYRSRLLNAGQTCAQPFTKRLTCIRNKHSGFG